MTRSIPSRLQRPLYDLLASCEPFESDKSLRAIFKDARLAGLQGRVPEAGSSHGRASQVVSFLVEEGSAGSGYALILFLQILGEYLGPTDRRYQELIMMMDEITPALLESDIRNTLQNISALKGYTGQGEWQLFSSTHEEELRAIVDQSALRCWGSGKHPNIFEVAKRATNSGTSRASAVFDFLMDKVHPDTGQNGVVVLLNVLTGWVKTDFDKENLTQLAQKLADVKNVAVHVNEKPEPVPMPAQMNAPKSPQPIAPPAQSVEAYTDLEIHIAPHDTNEGCYAVTAELDDENRYYGTLQMGATERGQLSAKSDPAEYGVMLFDILFAGNIRTAYEVARERAKNHQARLRLRLWIDHEAADLHALVWERLHYRREGGTFRVATHAKLPFSRYFGLQQDEASAITGPVRMLCVIANPQNLGDWQLAPLDVAAEVTALQEALAGLRQSGMSITIMPGRTGLPADLTRALITAGYDLAPGSTTLTQVLKHLAYAPGYHFVHFLGHGAFSQRKGQAALILEDDDGQARVVTDDDLAGRLAGLEHKPHLVFLAACQSAARAAGNANPFVGLAPRLVQIGIPAVVAMQDNIAMAAARELTQHFYHFLLQHGIVDKALNQARGFLVDTPDWATPVLFMRLREGQLLQRNSSISIAVPAPNPTAPAPQPATESEVTSLFGGASPLEMAKRILETLECQAAAYTALTIPAHLQIELEEQRKKVAALTSR